MADGANALLYALEGDWGNAAISAVGMVPMLGDTAKAGRRGKKLWDWASDTLHEQASPKVPRLGRNSLGGGPCETSRAARRQAMREAGIPTSSAPVLQGKTKSDYQWYIYGTVTNEGWQKTVLQHHPSDGLHLYPHWEAGTVRLDRFGNIEFNAHGTPRYKGGKNKIRIPYTK